MTGGRTVGALLATTGIFGGIWALIRGHCVRSFTTLMSNIPHNVLADTDLSGFFEWDEQWCSEQKLKMKHAAEDSAA